MANVAQLAREAIQTQNGEFTVDSISDEVREMEPNAKNSTVGMAIQNCARKGLIKLVRKEQHPKVKSIMNVYELVEGGDWSTWQIYKRKEKQIVSRETSPAKEKDTVSSVELGAAVIDFIESLKTKISEFAEENAKLKKRLSRTDDIALEMVREAKLERNNYYKALIKEKDSIIKRLNQRIETMNAGQSLTREKTFKMGDLATFRS
jgi:hypothetical protein